MVSTQRYALYFASMCEHPLTKNATAAPFCLCCYSLRCSNVWTGG